MSNVYEVEVEVSPREGVSRYPEHETYLIQAASILPVIARALRLGRREFNWNGGLRRAVRVIRITETGSIDA